MGVDRRLFISDRWDVTDVKETIESIYKIEVEVEATHTPDYQILNFTVPKLGKLKEDRRSMSVHHGIEVGGFKGLLLTLGASGRSDEIFTALAERLGGFYNATDLNSTYQEFQFRASGDLEFLLKDAIKAGASDGSSIDSFVEFLRAYSEKKIGTRVR